MPADHHDHRTPLVAGLARARRSCIAVALCALTSLAIAGPAAAAGQATVTTTVEHLFANPEHFEAAAPATQG